MIDINDPKYRTVGTSKDEETWHAGLAALVPFGFSIVEIGCLLGHTTRILLNNSDPNVPVFGIDPIIPDSMNPNLVGSAASLHNLEDEFNGRFSFIQDYSYNVYESFSGNSIGYLFIDGDHTYEAVSQDFNQWFPKVTIDGHIVLHDSTVNRGGPIHWPGSSRLADELLNDPRLEYVASVYCMTIFRKISNGTSN